MSAPVAHAVELRCGDMRLRVRPDLGGSVEGLWLKSLAVLRSKIGSGWDVLAQSEASLVLQHRHADVSGWPFPFVCVQSFLLTEEALTLSLHITHHADGPAPVGLGWHPYVVKRHGATVKFSAKARWDMGDDKLPTLQKPHSGLDQRCDDLSVDHCFDGWAGAVEVRDDALHTRIESSLNRLVVFTDPARDFIALEPVSHVNNALGQARTAAELAALGVQTLAPGQSYAASMRISTSLSPIHSRTLEISS